MKNRTIKKEIKKISKRNLKKIKGGRASGIETTGGIMRK